MSATVSPQPRSVSPAPRKASATEPIASPTGPGSHVNFSAIEAIPSSSVASVSSWVWTANAMKSVTYRNAAETMSRNVWLLFHATASAEPRSTSAAGIAPIANATTPAAMPTFSQFSSIHDTAGMTWSLTNSATEISDGSSDTSSSWPTPSAECLSSLRVSTSSADLAAASVDMMLPVASAWSPRALIPAVPSFMSGSSWVPARPNTS